MFSVDNWKEIIIALKKNKLRTFLTAFGVFWGIFMLIIMLGAGKGLYNAIFSSMGDFATNSCFMWTQPTSMEYKGLPRGRRFFFNNSDTEVLLKNIPEIKALSPRLNGRSGQDGENTVRGDKSGAFDIVGDYPDWQKIDPVKITEGRFINDIDIVQKRKVAVIGRKVVDALYHKDEKVTGSNIRINGIYFTVVGTFKSKKTGGQAEKEEQNIHLPFTTLQKTYNYGDRVGWYAIVAFDKFPAGIVEEKAKKILKARHKVHPDDNRAIGSFNVEKEFKKMTGLFTGINTLIWIVGLGTLIAGVIGVSNIMLVVVKERTKEIGIERALGAKPVNIIIRIINESVFLTSLAGGIGLTAGVWIIELINRVMNGGGGDMFKNPEVDFNVVLIALAVLVVAGALAGLLPAIRAVGMKPIDAIRDK